MRYKVFLGLLLAVASPTAAPAQNAPGAAGALVQQQTISLPNVKGRIDHLAIDPAGNRLFVAEHDNGTVDVVDLAKGQAAGRIGGLSEPQGVAYLADSSRIAVADGGDGSVRFFDGATLKPLGTVDLGDDADNIRLGPASGQIVVGYGEGGLAYIDPKGPTLTRRIMLAGHPESFQLEAQDDRAFVNVPTAGGIYVVDLKSGKAAKISTKGLGANFPMALGPLPGMVAVAFRAPSKVALVDATRGIVASADSCADADDIFIDGQRNRLYVACGDGGIDVFDVGPSKLAPAGRVATSDGARTAFFDAASDRLFVAAPARNGADAKIMVFRPGS